MINAVEGHDFVSLESAVRMASILQREFLERNGQEISGYKIDISAFLYLDYYEIYLETFEDKMISLRIRGKEGVISPNIDWYINEKNAHWHYDNLIFNFAPSAFNVEKFWNIRLAWMNGNTGAAEIAMRVNDILRS